ncbi:MAG: hypothetical protein O3A22_04945, partial [Bacteroidetes bacterium]|nr:hypothetical protein [Bacteroidota bacterium]
LFLDFFDQGQVLEDCDDIQMITANMEHTFVGDLTMWVTCPDGTEVILMENGPTGSADPNGCTPDDDVEGNNLGLPDNEGFDYSWNMDADWVLDDIANPDMADPIPAGVYLPCGDLCDFVGCPLNGIWSFTVFDQWGGDDGFLYEWGIDFNPEIVPGVTTFTPEIGLELDSSFWQVTLADEGVLIISDDMNSVDLEFPNPGIFDFSYQVTNNFGCTWDTTVNITVIEGPQTNITAGDDVIFCQDPVQLLGLFTGNGPSSCGGAGGSYDYCYMNNENTVFNYCPDVVGDGTMMTLSFSSGTMETCCDFINVFDGPNGTGALLQTFNTNIPGSTFTATNPDGCISFVLTSDGSVNCQDGFANFEELAWCVSCGGQDACGFDWSWTPTEYLDNPFVPQPTVLDFDGQPTAYTLLVEPIGFDNCSSIDVLMVFPDSTCQSCTDSTAFNFYPFATIDDGTCDYPSDLGVLQCGVQVSTNTDTISANGIEQFEDPQFFSAYSFSLDSASYLELSYDMYVWDTLYEVNVASVLLFENNTLTHIWSVSEYIWGYSESNIPSEIPLNPGSYTLVYGNYGYNMPLEEGIVINDMVAMFSQFDNSNGHFTFQMGLLQYDGTCDYQGCTDSTAFNFNPIATIDDGTCDFPNALGVLECGVQVSTNTDTISANGIETFEDPQFYYAYSFSLDSATSVELSYDINLWDCEFSCLSEASVLLFENNTLTNIWSVQTDFEGGYSEGNIPSELSLNTGSYTLVYGNYGYNMSLEEGMDINEVVSQFSQFENDNEHFTFQMELMLNEGACVTGCTSFNACNYSPVATVDDGSCLEFDECGLCGGDGSSCIQTCLDDDNAVSAVGGCVNAVDLLGCSFYWDDILISELCPESCNNCPCDNDFNDNGVCDDAEVFGCTYLDAVNYNSFATADNGSCEFETTNACPADLDGNGIVATQDLLSFLSLFGEICE